MPDSLPEPADSPFKLPGAVPVDLVEQLEDDFELPIAGFKGTPEEIERQWYEKVYKGRGDSMRQLTWRAVLMGSLLGSVLSLTNLYIGLKSGWGMGVAITACILSYSIWTGLYNLGIVGSKMTILENNCMQSTASAAGYSTGGTLISAIAAYIMLNPDAKPLSIPFLLAWVFFLAILGVTMAIPMKRQMVNIEQLRFPSGIAAAETLRALHSHSAKAARAAMALGISGGLAAVNQFLMEGLKVIHPSLDKYSITAMVERFNSLVLGSRWTDRTVAFAWDPVFMAAGALSGMRVGVSMMIGGTLCWVVFVPILQHAQVVPYGADYTHLVEWTLWGGVSCMLAAGLFAFAWQWRTIVRAFAGLGALLQGSSKRTHDPMKEIEAPAWWFFAGQGISLVALAWLAKATFDMPVWQAALAVVLSFFLALVACRVTGDTDTTPVGPMGKVTQLIFGGISPHHWATQVRMDINLMSANITAGAATSSADLLTDLKSGYLLGANPRKQFIAQFAGIFSGTLVTVLCFRLMVPNASVLGHEPFPAPSAQTWRVVAEAMTHGLDSLGKIKICSIVIGGLIGVLLSILSVLFPKREKWIPSAAGLGLAWTFHWYYSLLFFLGAIIAFGMEKASPKKSAEYLFPVASGIIAGGSLMAVALIFLQMLLPLK